MGSLRTEKKKKKRDSLFCLSLPRLLRSSRQMFISPSWVSSSSSSSSFFSSSYLFFSAFNMDEREKERGCPCLARRRGKKEKSGELLFWQEKIHKVLSTRISFSSRLTFAVSTRQVVLRREKNSRFLSVGLILSLSSFLLFFFSSRHQSVTRELPFFLMAVCGFSSSFFLFFSLVVGLASREFFDSLPLSIDCLPAKERAVPTALSLCTFLS